MKKTYEPPTNKERAGWGLKAIAAFIKEVGDAGDLETNMGDLIADLQHLATIEGLDWERILDTAGGHYRAEIKEEAGS